MTSPDPETSRSCLNIHRAKCLENGWRYGLGANRAPIGNDYWELNGDVNDDVA